MCLYGQDSHFYFIMDKRIRNTGSNIIKPVDYFTLTRALHPSPKPTESQHQFSTPSLFLQYPHPPPSMSLRPPVYDAKYNYQIRRNMYEDQHREEGDKTGRSHQRFLNTNRSPASLGHRNTYRTISKVNTQHSMDTMANIAMTIEEPEGQLRIPAWPYNFKQSTTEYGVPLTSKQPQILPKQRKRAPNNEYIKVENDSESEGEEADTVGALSGFSYSKGAKIKAHLSPSAKLRACVHAILFIFRTYSIMMRRNKQYREDYVQFMADDLQSIAKAAQSWALNAIRTPLVDILNDFTLDLDIFTRESWMRKHEESSINAKMLRIKQKIRKILEGLIKHTTDDLLPFQLKILIARYVRNGGYIPKQSLTPFERTRLVIDNLGATRHQSPSKKRMMISFYFITKLILKNLFLSPENIGIYVSKSTTISFNLKLISSVIQHLVLSLYIRVSRNEKDFPLDEHYLLNRGSTMGLNMANEDEISQHLFTFKEIQPIFTHLDSFLQETKELFNTWAEEFLALAEKTLLML